jgi:ABC-2 type transport system ATP-binding protein
MAAEPGGHPRSAGHAPALAHATPSAGMVRAGLTVLAGEHDLHVARRGTPLLVARDVVKSFGRRPVLRGVSLSVEPGTLVGVVGENGSGKSTLLRILAGELRPDGGEVGCRGSLGYCPQRDGLNTALTVEQHLRLFATAYGVKSIGTASELVARLGFAGYRDAQVCKLSGGTRQKLNLTLALMHDPDVLVLDEPYQGFDWETYMRFWDLVRERRERGRAVLVVSHLAHDARCFDRLLELHAGRLRDATERGAG